MPVRHAVVVRMVEHELGGPVVWDGLSGVVNDENESNIRRGVTNERWERTEAEADAAYERWVGWVDWSRILLEAAGLHAALHPDWDADAAWLTGVCGPCVQAALLTRRHGGPSVAEGQAV